MKKISWRGLAIILFLCVTVFYLAPLAIPNLPEWVAKNTLKLGLDLKGGMQILLEVDTSELSDQDAREAVDQNIKIIRDRIDKFGVAEPSIQKTGERRILIQLPGLADFAGAENLIKQTAMLEFKLVADPTVADQVVRSLDTYVTANIDQFPILADRKPSAPVMAEDDTLQTSTGIFSDMLRRDGGQYTIQWDVVPVIRALLADSLFALGIRSGYQLTIDKPDASSQRAERKLYVLQANAELSGADISRAKMEYGSPNSTDPRIANKPYISLEMNNEGSRKFETVTANNIDRQLSIVLDDMVYSAPVIRDRISGGRAQITGVFTPQEAHELTIVLNSGNLKAPIKPISTVIVGATLGSDSIKSGKMAGIIGLLAVMIFMIIYYKGSGFIADLALICNIGFVLAMLTAFGATLTLPGIAGIILTIGMAVDANVLIYERIREELDGGKTPRTAVDAGYKRAVITIWDANITTLIAAGVLYNFGTGPIRGFAITLAIGIIGSMFTAIVLVRAILETFVIRGNKKTLSI